MNFNMFLTNTPPPACNGVNGGLANVGMFGYVVPSWLNTLTNVATKILNPILIIACLVGVIYAIWIGVTFAKADSADQRKEAKNKLITVIVGIVAAGALIALFYWLKYLLIKEDITEDLKYKGQACCAAVCTQTATWDDDKTGIKKGSCCEKGDECATGCHCWKCCEVTTVNDKKYIHGIKDKSFWIDESGKECDDPTKAADVVSLKEVYYFVQKDKKWTLCN